MRVGTVSEERQTCPSVPRILLLQTEVGKAQQNLDHKCQQPLVPEPSLGTSVVKIISRAHPNGSMEAPEHLPYCAFNPTLYFTLLSSFLEQ